MTTGPYNELYPPPLIVGLSEDEIVEAYLRHIKDTGTHVDVPTRGKSRQGFVNLAIVHYHQRSLERAIIGELDTEEGNLIHSWVMSGRPISLRPLGMENLYTKSFAPVFTYTDGVGLFSLKNQKLHKTFSGTLQETFLLARAAYVTACEDESEKRKDQLKEGVKHLPHTVTQVIHLGRLIASGSDEVHYQQSVLQKMGNHGMYSWTRTIGRVFFEAHKPYMAIRYLHLMTRTSTPFGTIEDAKHAIQNLGGAWVARVDGIYKTNQFETQKLKTPHTYGLTHNKIRYKVSVKKGKILVDKEQKDKTFKPYRTMKTPNWDAKNTTEFAFSWLAVLLGEDGNRYGLR